MPQMCSPVGAMDLFRFLLQLEGLLYTGILEHVHRQPSRVVEQVGARTPGQAVLETAQQLQAFLQPALTGCQGRVDIRRAETAGDSAEGFSVLRRDDDRVIFHSQPAAVFAGLEGAVVDQRVRQANRRRQAHGSLAELGDDRTHRGPVSGRWWQVGCQGALRRRAPGHVPVHGPAVSGAAMMRRAHDGELLCVPGELWHVLGDLDPGRRR